MYPAQPSHDPPDIPLLAHEARCFGAIVRAETWEEPRLAVSRHVAHLRPSQCHFLAEMTVARIWRDPPDASTPGGPRPPPP
ncbi:hypothetical protein CLV63_110104 [Murinocardiopsis flavida]|uniref:Uncharacterized protein n=1 Tax=Murinocardiopsis flavida TaxID=645275 RepID=A0A2P8DHW4_9ACTN|nr:hypothetical protein [Murinocardiopsis flavida]PSK96807.1 hypothetical protein CLV63_110104 [Murinocardiopsis flavida]